MSHGPQWKLGRGKARHKTVLNPGLTPPLARIAIISLYVVVLICLRPFNSVVTCTLGLFIAVHFDCCLVLWVGVEHGCEDSRSYCHLIVSVVELWLNVQVKIILAMLIYCLQIIWTYPT